MAMFSRLHRFLTYFIYILTGRPATEAKLFQADAPEEPLIGTHGKITADVVLMIQDPYIVLVIDHEFLDIPSWVEWDRSRRTIGVVQSSGAIADVQAHVPKEMYEPMAKTRTLLLMTRFNGAKVAHRISLMVHD